MLKSVFELSYFIKKHVGEKVIFLKISKVRYFLLSGCADIIFGLLETFKNELLQLWSI